MIKLKIKLKNKLIQMMIKLKKKLVQMMNDTLCYDIKILGNYIRNNKF